MNDDVKQFFNEMADNWDVKEVKDVSWLTNFVQRHVPISKGMRVLDLGCGTGIISQILYDMTQAKVIAIDISDRMIELARIKHKERDIDFFVEDFYNTQLTGFDMIVCFNAYPHFVNIESFKDKVKEVLNENGYLVILHSLSRDELQKCHEGLSNSISRNLQTIDQEIEYYHEDFDVVDIIDNQEMFLMILQKRMI